MKKVITSKSFLISSLICLLSMVEGILVYNKLPDMVATHFTFSGIANGYSSKGFAVFFLPVLFVGLNFLIHLSFEYSDKYKNASKFYTIIFKWLCAILSVVVQTSVILYSFEINVVQFATVVLIAYILLAVTASAKDRKHKEEK